MDSTWDMWRSKKSISGHLDVCSASRISGTAVVENTRGVAGPAIASSRMATTRRASSTVVMNGIRCRSNRRSGNWISSALPIVSALMPVLSDRKNTGTAGWSSALTPAPESRSPGPAGRVNVSCESRWSSSQRDLTRVATAVIREW